MPIMMVVSMSHAHCGRLLIITWKSLFLRLCFELSFLLLYAYFSRFNRVFTFGNVHIRSAENAETWMLACLHIGCCEKCLCWKKEACWWKWTILAFFFHLNLWTVYVFVDRPIQKTKTDQIFWDWQWHRFRICFHTNSVHIQKMPIHCWLETSTDNGPKLTWIWNAARNTWSWSLFPMKLNAQYIHTSHIRSQIQSEETLWANAKRVQFSEFSTRNP